MIRFLVLHAAYSSAENEQRVLFPPFISDLEASGKASFTFVDGPVVIDPNSPDYAAFASVLPPPPNRRWWGFDLPLVAEDAPLAYDPQSAAKAVEIVRQAWFSHGPFDALMGFSEGGSVIASLLYEEFLRQKETSDAPILKALRGAIFISSPPPLVADPPHDPTAIGKVLSADDYGQLFDLKTLHIFGSHDTSRARIRELMRLCNTDKASLLDTARGHILPRDAQSIDVIKNAISNFVEELSQPAYVIRRVGPSDAPAKIKALRYELSDVDAMNLSTHIYNYLFFPLDEAADTQAISIALETGLSETLAQVPMLAGRVFRDGPKRAYVVRQPEDACDLGIRYLEDSFPSFEAMRAAHFAPSMLLRESLVPPGSAPSSTEIYGRRFDEDGVPCWYMQANFAKGGLILASAFNHQVADAWSSDRFLGLLAENTRVAMDKRAPGPQLPFELDVDRAPYNCEKKNNTDYTLQKFAQEWVPSVAHHVASGSLASVMARTTPWKDVHGILVYVPLDKAAELKQYCAPKPPDYVTTYDCVSAMLFRVVTRARLQAGRIKPDEATSNWHAVNVRGRSADARKSYFGNGVVVMPTAPMTAQELADEGGLQRAAQEIRRGILNTDVRALRRFADAHFRLEAEKVVEAVAAYLTTGGLTTSWQQMRLSSYDLGFGPPCAFRSPGLFSDGGLVLLPTLPGEGVVAWAGSSKECIELMEKDPELLRWAQVWGVERAFA